MAEEDTSRSDAVPQGDPHQTGEVPPPPPPETEGPTETDAITAVFPVDEVAQAPGPAGQAQDQPLGEAAMPAQPFPPQAPVSGQFPPPPPFAQAYPYPPAGPQPTFAYQQPLPAPPQYVREQDYLGQPYLAGPRPAPSAGTLTLRAIWQVPLQVWRGRPLDGLDQVHQIRERTGKTWPVWVITLAINVVLLATAATAAMGRRFGTVTVWGSAQMPMQRSQMMMPGLPTGRLVLLFLALLIALAVGLAARAFGLYLTQRSAGATVSFSRVVTSFAASQMLFTLPLAAVAFVALLGGLPAIMPVVMIAALGLVIMAEVVNYLAVLREGPHRFSPLVPFAWFTVLAVAIAGLIELLVMQLLVIGLLG